MDYEYSETNLRVDIEIPARYKKLQKWNSGSSEVEKTELSSFSWFLNGFYNQEITQGQNQTADFDSAVAFGGVAIEGRYSTDFQERKQTQYFRLVKDIEDIPMRLTLGDTIYQTIGQQRSFLTSGITIESNFNLQPYTKYFPTTERAFFLVTPSWVEVRINGRFFSRRFLQTGRHIIDDIPVLIGQNQIDLLIEEKSGRTRTISFNDTGTREVYKKDVHFFSYTLGSLDLALSDRYRDSSTDFEGLFSFYHLYGLNSYVTVGGYGQIAQEEKLFALTTNWRSSFLNGTFTAAKAETEKITAGNYYELTLGQIYWGSQKRRGFEITGSYAEAGYKRIGEQAITEDRFSAEAGVNWEHSRGFFSSIGGTWESVNDDYLAFYTISKNTSRFGSQLRLEHSRNDGFAFEINLNFNWGSSRNLISQYQYSSRNKNHLARTTYSSPYNNRGVQIDAQYNKGETGESQQVDLNYTHERFLASADTTRGEGGELRSQARVSSAISFVDGHWGWSRPITQAFAIVDIEGSDKSVSINPSGQDDHFETVSSKSLNGVLTQINPYTAQSITIESRNDDALRFENDQAYIVPSYRTGYLVKFQAKGSQLTKGKIFVAGKALPVNVFSFIGLDDDSEEISFTDEEGRFWVDGIKPGKYIIEIFDKKSKPFVVKDGESFQDLGVIELVLDK